MPHGNSRSRIDQIVRSAPLIDLGPGEHHDRLKTTADTGCYLNPHCLDQPYSDGCPLPVANCPLYPKTEAKPLEEVPVSPVAATEWPKKGWGLKGCLFCGGDVYLDTDGDWRCLQCSREVKE